MKNPSLNVVNGDEKEPFTQANLTAAQLLRKHAEAKYERIWLQNPEKFNPNRDCMSRESFNRAWEMVLEALPLKGMRSVDLGCGYGLLSVKMRDAGAELVDAVDVASNALKQLETHDMTGIRPFQDYVPYTHLEDNGYDLVVCTELIAELPPNEYRLFFSELSRLVKPTGKVVCSTPLDIYSEDPLEKFCFLAETELILESLTLSYHILHIKLLRFFETPKKWVAASRDHHLHDRIMREKKGLQKGGFPGIQSFRSSIFGKA